jgi:hypothetical protein
MSQAEYRAAAVRFLTDYATDTDTKLQVYPGRPRTLYPPTAFVDGINEVFTSFTERHFQRVPQVTVIVLFGLFDSADAVQQKDEFVDGFVAWAYENPHEAGANTLIRVSETRDLPDYVPEWIAPQEQKTYYATEIVLEGFGTN